MCLRSRAGPQPSPPPRLALCSDGRCVGLLWQTNRTLAPSTHTVPLGDSSICSRHMILIFFHCFLCVTPTVLRLPLQVGHGCGMWWGPTHMYTATRRQWELGGGDILTCIRNIGRSYLLAQTLVSERSAICTNRPIEYPLVPMSFQCTSQF